MSKDPIEPHNMLGRDIIQRLVALLDQWRHSDSHKSFQIRLTIRADTHVLLLFTLKLIFMNTRQDRIYISLKNCSVPSERKAEPSSHILPIDSSPGPLPHLGPLCKPDKPFDYRRSPSSFGPVFPSQHSNPIFGLKIERWPHGIYPHITYGVDC